MRSTRWWDRGNSVYDTADGSSIPEDPSKEIVRISEAIWESQGVDRLTLAEAALTLYFGSDRHSLASYQSGAAFAFGLDEPSSYNVIQACTDTKTSHIVRNKVRPFFLTEAGDWALREKAQGMQRAVEAIFGEVGLYGDVGMSVCLDGNLFDAGAVKWCLDYANNRIVAERVFAHDLLIPEREARLGKPRQIGHRMTLDRDVLIDFFKDDPEAVEAIKNAPSVSYTDMGANDELADPGHASDQVRAYEWWHLPSGRVDRSDPKAFGINDDGEFDPNLDPGHDGRHVICIDGHTLLDEPWPYEYFPVAFFRPQKNPDGFWSRGIPETLAGCQLAINKWSRRIDAILHFHAIPRLVVQRNAKINKSKITNDIAGIIETDNPGGIQVLSPQSVPAELVARVDRLIAWAEKQIGLSELSISAQKPAGVDHAPGMQFLADSESIRHTVSYRAWEDFHVDSSRIVVDMLRMLAERNPDYEVIFGDAKDLKRIKWREVDAGVERYHLKTWPTNLLPQTPAAKASRIIEFLNAGLFTREDALAALDYPDIEAIEGDTTSEIENIEQKINLAIKGEAEKSTPHGYLNLALAMKMAKSRINRMEADGEDWDSIGRVIAFWEECHDLALRAQAEEVNAAKGEAPPSDAAPPPQGAPPPEAPPPAA